VDDIGFVQYSDALAADWRNLETSSSPDYWSFPVVENTTIVDFSNYNYDLYGNVYGTVLSGSTDPETCPYWGSTMVGSVDWFTNGPSFSWVTGATNTRDNIIIIKQSVTNSWSVSTANLGPHWVRFDDGINTTMALILGSPNHYYVLGPTVYQVPWEATSVNVGTLRIEP